MTPINCIRRLTAALLVTLSALVSAHAARFDIPSQPAPAAFKLFIEQSGTEVLFGHDDVQSVKTNAVSGEYAPDAALRLLLENTGLGIKSQTNKKFIVAKARETKPGSIEGQVRDESGKPVAGARVSVAGSEATVVTDRRGRFLLEDVPPGAQAVSIFAEGMQKTRVTDVVVQPGHRHTLSSITIPAIVAGITQLEDYIVSARKSGDVFELDPYEVSERATKPFSTASIDVVRSDDDALPFTTFTSRDIEQSGAINVEEFLRARLPQNFSPTIPEEQDSNTNSASSGDGYIDFRGWGAGETVVLLNGRRLPGRALSGLDSTPGTPNFRGIPVGSIERIEILPSAGSAIYGENASAGAINIITRQDYRGGSLTAAFEHPFDSSGYKMTASLTYGMPLTHGFGIRVAGGYSTSKSPLIGERASVASARWRALVLAREPSRIIGPTLQPTRGGTTNIRSATLNAAGGATLNTTPLFGPGTPYYTSVPDGYIGGQGISPFLSRQGVYNMSLGDGSVDALYSKHAPFGKDSESQNLMVALDKEVGENWKLSLEYSHNNTQRTNDISDYMEFEPGTTRLVVPAAAPTNPFGLPVVVSFDDPRMNRPGLADRSVATIADQVVATVRGGFGSWRVLADCTYFRNRDRWTYGGYSTPVGGWQNALLTGAYNPFVDMRSTAPAASSFYDEYVAADSDLKTASRTMMATLKLSGPMIELPAGPAMATAGVEWTEFERYEYAWIVRYLNSRTGAVVPRLANDPTRRLAANNPPSRFYEADTYAAYAEAVVPVLAEKHSVPLIEHLDVFASGRLTRQERTGFDAFGVPISYESNPTLYAAGLRYDIFAGVRLRASRSLGFRPALLGDDVIAGTPPTQSIPATDRRRNEAVVLEPSQYVTGGNPDLEPETVNSTNIGLQLNPHWLKGARFSLDYVESIRDNAISSLGVQTVLDLESDATIAARIQRGPASPGSPNGVGPILFVDARSINLREIKSKSLDVSFDYVSDELFGGRLYVSLTGTKNLSFRVQTTATSLPVEQVRNASASFTSAAFSQQLEWNANGQARWEGKAWAFGWGARFFDDILARPADYNIQGSDRAEWEIEHDVFVSYRFDAARMSGWKGALLNNTGITVGLKNVFDREPRFWAANTGRGYLSYDSINGRTFWVQLRRTL